MTVQRCYGVLEKAAVEAAPDPVKLNYPGVTELPQWQMRVLSTTTKQIANGPYIFTVVPEGTVVVRSRLPGDEMRLSGGTKSLKKLFIDKKIPATQRDKVPVLADDKGVLAVFGLGVNLDRVPPEGNGISFLFVK